MDEHPTNAFADIIHLAQANFSNVQVEIDSTPVRAILRLQATYGVHRLSITELVDTHHRKYRYYALLGHQVIAGFDNSPDPRALRLKYGRIGTEHTGELVPHLHLNNKTELMLTAEIYFAEFLAWLKQNLLST